MKSFVETTADTAAARASIENVEQRNAAVAAVAATSAAAGVSLVCAAVPHLVLLRNPMLGDAVSAKDAAQSLRLALGLSREEAQKSIHKIALTAANKIAGRFLAKSAVYWNAADWTDTVRLATADVVRFAGKNRVEDVTLAGLQAILAPEQEDVNEDAKAERKLRSLVAAVNSLTAEADLDAIAAAVMQRADALKGVVSSEGAADVVEQAAADVAAENAARAAKRLEKAAKDAEARRNRLAERAA